MRVVFQILIFIVSTAFCEVVIASGGKFAMVIGNSSYEGSARLKNPINDARLIAEDLKSLQFNVRVVNNFSSRQLEEALLQFFQDSRQADVAVIYYAGHGFDVEGKSYLIPVNMNPVEVSATHIKRDAFSFSWMESQLKAKGVKLSVFFIDACRQVPDRRLMIQQANAGAKSLQSALYLYSTLPGALARDGRGENSPFASALHQYLPQRTLSLMQVVQMTRRHLNQATGGSQMAYLTAAMLEDYNLFTGDVYLPALDSAVMQGSKATEPTSNSTKLRQGFLYWRDNFEDLNRELEQLLFQMDHSLEHALNTRAISGDSIAQTVLGTAYSMSPASYAELRDDWYDREFPNRLGGNASQPWHPLQSAEIVGLAAKRWLIKASLNGSAVAMLRLMSILEAQTLTEESEKQVLLELKTLHQALGDDFDVVGDSAQPDSAPLNLIYEALSKALEVVDSH
jgi:hypothetical protein